MAYASNWCICNAERRLVEVYNVPVPPPPYDKRVEGQAIEELAVKEHPEWGGLTQQTALLPTGRKCRCDALTPTGVIEVKGLSPQQYDKLSNIGDFLAGHKYQQEYLFQLVTYCTVWAVPGEFCLYNKETGQHKHITLTLAQAKDLVTQFRAGQIKPNSCAYCNVAQACAVFEYLSK